MHSLPNVPTGHGRRSDYSGEVDLHNDVGEIEHFTEEESYCVDVVATLVRSRN